LPFRMCTIYETPQAVRAMLTAEGARFTRTLARLHGKAEWGVKAFAGGSPASSSPARPASGAAYLAARRAERERADAGRDAIEADAAALHARLAAQAAGAVLSRPQDRWLSGRRHEMVLNGAYLVPRDEADAFAGLVDWLASESAPDGL